MTIHPVIAVDVREKGTKGSIRAARRRGETPGIIYGGSKAPVLCSLEAKALDAAIERGVFLSTLYEIDVKGKKETVLPREVQLHPVTDSPLHVDFLRVTANTRISVNVAVRFEDEAEAPGIKRGGVLNVVRREVELSCRASAIPNFLTASLAGLDIGDSIRISGIELPEGTTPIIQRDFIVATIAAPTIQEEPTEASDEETVEGETALEEGSEAEDKEGKEDKDKEEN